MKMIIESLNDLNVPFEMIDDPNMEIGVIVLGKMAAVKSQLNKYIKEKYNYKIFKPKAYKNYFGTYEFKNVIHGSTTGGFDMREIKKDGKYYTKIYTNKGGGYWGQD